MPYFKDTENKIHFLDDPDFAYLLPAGCVEITDEEAATLSAPPAPTDTEITLGKIAQLEASVTDRRIREAVLGLDNGWLKALNDQCAALRKGLK